MTVCGLQQLATPDWLLPFSVSENGFASQEFERGRFQTWRSDRPY
jgi:hypothetical protein